MFDDEMYFEFLNIRNWPLTFQKWVSVRRDELTNQKEMLIKEMTKETDKVFEKAMEFKNNIKDILKKGLVKLSHDDREQREEKLKSYA